MTLTLVKGHKGPVKGLRASGPQGLDPYLLILVELVANYHTFVQT
jgi:hypothetical protein